MSIWQEAVIPLNVIIFFVAFLYFLMLFFNRKHLRRGKGMTCFDGPKCCDCTIVL